MELDEQQKQTPEAGYTSSDSENLSDSPIPNNIDEEETIEAPSKFSDAHVIDLVRSYFNLEASEKFIEDFICTLSGSATVMGHLMLLDKHLCFAQEPKKLQKSKLLEGHVLIKRLKKSSKMRKRYLVATKDHLAIGSEKSLYQMYKIIPWKDIFSVEWLDPSLARTSWGFLFSTTAANFSVVVDSKEEGEAWIQLIKSKINQKDPAATSPRHSREEDSLVKKSLDTQVTFSLAIDRITSVQSVNSTIFPNGTAIQYDQGKELILTNMDEAELLVSFLQTVINNRSAEEKKKQKKRSPSLSERLESPITTTVSKSKSYEMKITQKDEQFFHDKFKLGEAEKLHAVYNCALFNAADFFGKLYVSDQHISYFNTDVNQLTKQNKIIIPLSEVTDVGKYKVMLLTTGLKISTKAKSYKFANLGSASKAINLIRSLAEKAKKGKTTAVAEKVDSDSEGSESPNLEHFKNLPSKRITITLVGTRGDVQPFMALAFKLREYGHTVKIATHAVHKNFVESYGIPYVQIAGDPRDLIKLCVSNESFSLKFIREANKQFRVIMEDILLTCWEACKYDTDVLIENPPCFAGIHVAEKLNIPHVIAFTMPWTPSGNFSHPFAYREGASAAYNKASFFAAQQGVFQMLRSSLNKFRRQTLGLPSISVGDYDLIDRRKVHQIYCWSPSVVPKPHDWGKRVHVSGYWFLDAPKDFLPNPELQAFLAKEPKPIYIGFGSVIVKDPDALTKTIIEAVRVSGQRAILAKGWGGTNVDKYPDFIFPLDAVPHDWLFPQLTAAVHHGGAGTTAAAMRAGIPTMIVPFFGDQFFWADVIERLNNGPRRITVNDMTVENFAAALTQMATDTIMRKVATTLGEHIRSQNGPERAVQLIHQAVHEWECSQKVKSTKTNIKYNEVKVIIRNNTKFRLRRKSWQLKQGDWISVPAEFIPAHSTIDIKIKQNTNTIFNDTEGFVEYTCADKLLTNDRRWSSTSGDLTPTQSADSPNPSKSTSSSQDFSTHSASAASSSIVFNFSSLLLGTLVGKKNSGRARSSDEKFQVETKQTYKKIEFNINEASGHEHHETIETSMENSSISEENLSNSHEAANDNAVGEKQNSSKYKGFTVIIDNQTEYELTRTQCSLKHGDWIQFAPEKIKPNTKGSLITRQIFNFGVPSIFVSYLALVDNKQEILSIFYKQKRDAKHVLRSNALTMNLVPTSKTEFVITITKPAK